MGSQGTGARCAMCGYRVDGAMRTCPRCFGPLSARDVDEVERTTCQDDPGVDLLAPVRGPDDRIDADAVAMAIAAAVDAANNSTAAEASRASELARAAAAALVRQQEAEAQAAAMGMATATAAAGRAPVGALDVGGAGDASEEETRFSSLHRDGVRAHAGAADLDEIEREESEAATIAGIGGLDRSEPSRGIDELDPSLIVAGPRRRGARGGFVVGLGATACLLAGASLLVAGGLNALGGRKPAAPAAATPPAVTAIARADAAPVHTEELQARGSAVAKAAAVAAAAPTPRRSRTARPKTRHTRASTHVRTKTRSRATRVGVRRAARPHPIAVASTRRTRATKSGPGSDPNLRVIHARSGDKPVELHRNIAVQSVGGRTVVGTLIAVRNGVVDVRASGHELRIAERNVIDAANY